MSINNWLRIGIAISFAALLSTFIVPTLEELRFTMAMVNLSFAIAFLTYARRKRQKSDDQ